jgi:hypothetical protein
MRAVAAIAALVVAAGCGPAHEASSTPGKTRSLSAYGMSVALPSGWTGRILLGAAGRPVLHAGSFPVPSNDDDSGEIAKESMGRDIYLNVRDLGPGVSAQALPVSFSASEFAPPHARGWRVNEASREIAASGELYRVTALSGGQDPPSQRELDEANGVLRTLALDPYVHYTVPALPPAATQIEGYGISMRLPGDWKGKVTRGELDAGSAQIHLRLLERGGTDIAFAARKLPIELSNAEFVGPGGGFDPRIVAGTGRSFIVHGREFVLWVEADSLPPDPWAVEQTNEALATLKVEPGDFYPGKVEPAAFATASGWNTGTNGSVEVQPEGQQTWTWASTIPFADDPPEFPSRTLRRLPPGGIVITAQLFGPDKNGGGRNRAASPPFRLSQGQRSYPWEGQIGKIPLYHIGGRVPGQRYDVGIAVFFGRLHPTPDQVAAADAELARLDTPDWSATD